MRRLRRKNRKTGLVVLLFVLVVLMTVGYASLSTNLNIGGTAIIKKQSMRVYFDNLQVKNGSVNGSKVIMPPSILGTTTTMLNWKVSLESPGEFYEFNVDVVNDGTLDVMIDTATSSIVETSLNNTQSKYLNYSIKYINGVQIEKYDKLEKGETKTITIRLEYKNIDDINPEDLPATSQDGIDLHYEADYVQADSRAVEKDTLLHPNTMTITTSNNVTEVIEGKKLQLVVTTTPSPITDKIYWSSSNTSVATVSNLGLVTGVSEGNVTLTATAKDNKGITHKTATINIVVKRKSLEIGDNVNYSTSLNGVVLNNWKVFYKDVNNTYLIYGDYLPNSAVDTTNLAGIEKSGDYVVKSNTNRTDLLNAMATKSNWDSLLIGTLNGTIEVNESRTANIWAMGSPDIELWVNSWNVSYPDDLLYTRYDISRPENKYEGWFIGNVENPTTKYFSVADKEGYSNKLYYPYKGQSSNKPGGYWLASLSAYNDNNLMMIDCWGNIAKSGLDGELSFRPVICIPSNLLNQ